MVGEALWVVSVSASVNTPLTMHSSRMYTARSLTVSPSMLCSGGGVPGLGGCLVQGMPAWSRGVPAWSGGGGIPACTEADPPCEQNHRPLLQYYLAPTSLRAVITPCLPIQLLCASSTGDLTDAKYADLRGSMQYVEEWSDYQRVLQRSGVLNKTVWFDIRGNHGNQLLH